MNKQKIKDDLTIQMNPEFKKRMEGIIRHDERKKTAKAIFEEVEKMIDDDLKTYENCKKHVHTEWIECLRYFKIKLKKSRKKWCE